MSSPEVSTESPLDTLENRIVLITGAASGIGRATAERVGAEGATVCAVDLDLAGAEAIAADLGGLAIAADVGELADLERAVGTCERELGGLDLVHLNAGVVTGHDEVHTIPEDRYRRIMRVNVDGVVFGVRAAVPALVRRGGGAIVATSSLAGIIPFSVDPWYALTKHAVVGFIRSIAPAVEPLGITANCVNPGLVDTPMLGDEAKELLVEGGFPLLEAAEIADTVVRVATSGRSGECWVCQPGRPPEPYRFHDVPGPRAAGGEGRVPPGVDEGRLPLA